MAHIAQKDKKFLKGAFGTIYMVALFAAPEVAIPATAVAAGVCVGVILLIRFAQ